MYKKHFGFRERPFQLVPNPAYLFLSKSHEEALAHLNYATSQGDGFVEITGEVGTGKTTLCRAFIESLDSTTEVAYIFNPMLTAAELLAAVHDEFAIAGQAGSVKALIDSLNRFLIEKKAEGKRVLLIIDEAQNLSRDVLEQVRLLSNLETNTEKLLQIILVGQPELGEMLDSFELRQLSQRITLSAHLTPLSYSDTVRYVHHRLHIASRGAKVRFSSAAFRRIYRYSRGVPRLIHIVCDRALLVAYVLNRQQVTGGMVRVAIRELAGRGERKRGVLKGLRVPATVVILAGFAALVGVAFHVGYFSLNSLDFSVKKLLGRGGTSEIAERVAEKSEAPEPPPPSAPSSVPVTAGGLKTGLGAASVPESRLPAPLPYVVRHAALISALSHWGVVAEISPVIQATRNDPAFFRTAAEQNGFEMVRLEGDLTLLFTLNLPAILTVYEPGAGSLQYLVLVQREGEKMTLAGAEEGEKITLSTGEVAAFWAGVAYIPWKNFLGCRGTIPLGTTETSILALKQLLKNAGYNGIAPGSVYDEGARAAIRTIQEKYGLPVDGIVGSLTKILLYNEQGTFDIPFLTRAASSGTPQPTPAPPTPVSQLKARLN